MMYVADLLTLSRVCMGVFVFIEILQRNWQIAVAVFIVAALTDAVDGAFAKAWPYPDIQKLWVPLKKLREYPHIWDNFADSTLVYITTLGLAIRFSGWYWVVLIQIVAGLIMLISRSMYSKKSPIIAGKIDILLMWAYVLQLFAMLTFMTIQAVEWWPIAAMFYATFGLILLIVRWDKATSRPDAAYWKNN